MHNTAVTATAKMAGVNIETSVNYYNMFREVCSADLLNEELKFGGVGKTVEIDETFLGKARKYQRGATPPVKGEIFGIWDRETKRGFMRYIGGKSHSDLIPIIQHFILPGTTICTDGLPTYKCLGNLGFIHKSVNHSIGQYVDKNDPSNHINGIEGMWGRLKVKFKAMHGNRTELIPSILDDYVWKSYWKSQKFERFIIRLRLQVQ